ncbi:hypothetical protein EBU99_13985 [bacterium]|nr:hypothetical protein [bacterium]
MPKYAVRVKQTIYSVRYIKAKSKRGAAEIYGGVSKRKSMSEVEYDYKNIEFNEEVLNIKKVK